MKFIDLFAGIGGFRSGMERAGHECVGFCEFDKYAVASYTSMYLITDEQREYLATLPLKERQKEILKEKYRNGEWYANDIRAVRAADIPKADCWCFGFPCQDISVAGHQSGFYGNRSSLFFRVMRLVNDVEEKPRFLFIENVKNLLSVNRGWDFARLLVELDRGGYDAEWCLLNSKNFGVPQNRERVSIVGHLRGSSGQKVFPVESTDGENRIPINQVGMLKSERVNPNRYRVYGASGIAPSLDTMGGGGKRTSHYRRKGASLKRQSREREIVVLAKLDPNRHSQMDVLNPEGICPTLDTLKERKKVALLSETPIQAEEESTATATGGED